MTPSKILSEVRCQIQYQYQIKLEMSNSIPIGSLLDSASESDSKSNELNMYINSLCYGYIFKDPCW